MESIGGRKLRPLDAKQTKSSLGASHECEPEIGSMIEELLETESEFM